MGISFAGFKYSNLLNLGDHIQSIATERLIGPVDKRFDREELANLDNKEEYYIVMNGWFAHDIQRSFPPVKQIKPIFWGFHVSDHQPMNWDYMTSELCISYLKNLEPIGCRDRYTAERLKASGVRAFYSKCLTLTLPKREEPLKYGWNIIVDVNFPLPPLIEKSGIRVTHSTLPSISEEDKFKQANQLLDLYRTKASCVITSRLHCALPCIAMGIPVLFFGDPQDYRISILTDIGVNINEHPKELQRLQVNSDAWKVVIRNIWEKTVWTPSAINIDHEKRKIENDFKSFLDTRLSRY